MPQRSFRECNYINCHNLTKETYCPEHTRARYDKEVDKKRGSAYQRGYGKKWQRERKLFLVNNPLCIGCKSKGIVTASKVVDHIVPHRGDDKLFWNRRNWQALCKPCHDRKTAKGL